MAVNRQDKAYINALARSLYWGYSKEAMGEPQRLRELAKPDQDIWINMAKRAIRRIEELDAAEQS